MVISLFVAFLVTLAFVIAIDEISTYQRKKNDKKKRDERMLKNDDEEEAWASFSLQKKEK